MIEADLHDRYGIDCDDRDLMRARSWRWLSNRILALTAIPPTYVIRADGRVFPVQATRLMHALYPPRPPDSEGS